MCICLRTSVMIVRLPTLVICVCPTLEMCDRLRTFAMVVRIRTWVNVTRLRTWVIYGRFLTRIFCVHRRTWMKYVRLRIWLICVRFLPRVTNYVYSSSDFVCMSYFDGVCSSTHFGDVCSSLDCGDICGGLRTFVMCDRVRTLGMRVRRRLVSVRFVIVFVFGHITKTILSTTYMFLYCYFDNKCSCGVLHVWPEQNRKLIYFQIIQLSF